MPTLVKMPKWGLTMTTGKVTDWLAVEGAEVVAGEPLFVVETEKAVNDVEAPSDGVLRKIVADIGSEVAVAGAVAALCAGIRSGLSYCGAFSIPELHERARFVRITPAGYRESQPHDVTVRA